MTHTRNVLIALGLIIVDQTAKTAFFFYEPLKSHLFINYERPMWLSFVVLLLIGICYILLVKKDEKSLPASNQLNKEKYGSILWGLTLIFAGGVSNLIDQFFVGGIIDMGKIYNLTFNVADVIVLAGIWIIINDLLKKKADKRN